MLRNRVLYSVVLWLWSMPMLTAQDDAMLNQLRFAEYMGYVKKFHPIVKQAALKLNEGEAQLMKARGFFDPKIDLDYSSKEFKNSTYFKKLSTTFKIPTWYGITLKANYEQNEGDFLNLENTVPIDGLYSAGIELSLAKGLLMNPRMAALKKAKLLQGQMKADRDLLVNQSLTEAAIAYFNWVRAFEEQQVYASFVNNAKFRLESVKQSIKSGDAAAIDSVEANITFSNRKLNLIKAQVKYRKASLTLATFLWVADDLPLELKETIVPEINIDTSIDLSFGLATFMVDTLNLEEHPKVRSLQYKYDQLSVERRLKRNALLPTIDLSYNFLSTTPTLLNSFSDAQYKAGMKIEFPLFLRKERGDVKFTNAKLQNTNFEIIANKQIIKNKVAGIVQDLNSFKDQNQIIAQMVSDYATLVKAEERKFEVGDSSLFLVNTRETKFIEAKLKQIELTNTYYKTKAQLFNTVVNPVD